MQIIIINIKPKLSTTKIKSISIKTKTNPSKMIIKKCNKYVKT